MKTLSWILIALVSTLTLLLSLASMQVAYFAEDDPIGPASGPTMRSAIGESHPEAVPALRARRGTAAAYAAGYATLMLMIVLGPYRRGDVWAWWSVLAGTLVSCGIILLRVPTVGTNLGLAAATVPLGVIVVALALDAKRLKA